MLECTDCVKAYDGEIVQPFLQIGTDNNGDWTVQPQSDKLKTAKEFSKILKTYDSHFEKVLIHTFQWHHDLMRVMGQGDKLSVQEAFRFILDLKLPRDGIHYQRLNEFLTELHTELRPENGIDKRGVYLRSVVFRVFENARDNHRDKPKRLGPYRQLAKDYGMRTANGTIKQEFSHKMAVPLTREELKAALEELARAHYAARQLGTITVASNTAHAEAGVHVDPNVGDVAGQPSTGTGPPQQDSHESSVPVIPSSSTDGPIVYTNTTDNQPSEPLVHHRDTEIRKEPHATGGTLGAGAKQPIENCLLYSTLISQHTANR